MERITRFRIGIVLLLLLLVMGFYATKLYQLQVVETGGQPSDNMTTFTTLTRVKAARGDLTDRNGNVLVGSRASYDLVINHFVLNNSDNRNNYIYQLVTLAKSMGVQLMEHGAVDQVMAVDGQVVRWLEHVADLPDVNGAVVVHFLIKVIVEIIVLRPGLDHGIVDVGAGNLDPAHSSPQPEPKGN